MRLKATTPTSTSATSSKGLCDGVYVNDAIVLKDNLQEAGAVFARVGKRHIINLDYVYQISVLKQKLVLSDGEVFVYPVSISKDALKKLKEMYVNTLCSSANND